MSVQLKAIAVDDDEANLILIESLLGDMGLDLETFMDPLEALEYCRKNTIDLAFVDYMMPQMDGIEFIREVTQFNKDIPIVMITAASGDESVKIEAIRAGATEFLSKPIKIIELKARVKNLANLRHTQILLHNRALLLEEEVRKATESIVEQHQEALHILGNVAEYKDPETAAHITRVALYSRLLGRFSGDAQVDGDLLFFAAPLHDIGKIGVPDNILFKKGKLNPEEFDLMKLHTTNGYNILKNAKNPYLKAGSLIAYTHHEKFNGTGYPRGLKGKEIPVYGRIVGIADVFDALTTVRPYKDAWPLEKAVKYLLDHRGDHFDPELIDLFIDKMEEIKNIYHTNREE